jgi:hypothetical protein
MQPPPHFPLRERQEVAARPPHADDSVGDLHDRTLVRRRVVPVVAPAAGSDKDDEREEWCEPHLPTVGISRPDVRIAARTA